MVIARAPIPGRGSPLGLHPAFDQHSLESGIQRSLFHLKNIIGDSLDRVSDLVPVHFTGTCERLQNQKIKSSRRNLVSTQSVPLIRKLLP